MFSHFCAGSDIKQMFFNFLILGKSRFPPKKFYNINYWAPAQGLFFPYECVQHFLLAGRGRGHHVSARVERVNHFLVQRKDRKDSRNHLEDEIDDPVEGDEDEAQLLRFPHFCLVPRVRVF